MSIGSVAATDGSSRPAAPVSLGYILEWRLSEIYAYLASQYLWRHNGVPGINNDDQIGFLSYAYQVHYGDRVGALVAQALDGGSNVNEAMVIDGVHGAQFPETGQPLHRDYQYLAVQADRAVQLAEEAYQLYAGKAPNFEAPVYRQEEFRWDGYDEQVDHLFKAETLRRLCVSTRRSQKMCEAALAHRLAMRLAAEQAPLAAVFEQLDLAIAAAEADQRLYQLNYDDDYDGTDGLCVRLADRLRSVRDQFVLASGLRAQQIARAWSFDAPGKLERWTLVHDTSAPLVEQNGLHIAATGSDPLIVLDELLSIPVSDKHFVEIRLASDRPGRAELFWTDRGDDERAAPPSPRLWAARAGCVPGDRRPAPGHLLAVAEVARHAHRPAPRHPGQRRGPDPIHPHRPLAEGGLANRSGSEPTHARDRFRTRYPRPFHPLGEANRYRPGQIGNRSAGSLSHSARRPERPS